MNFKGLQEIETKQTLCDFHSCGTGTLENPFLKPLCQTVDLEQDVYASKTIKECVSVIQF